MLGPECHGSNGTPRRARTPHIQARRVGECHSAAHQAVRLVPLGQTDGQASIAALRSTVKLIWMLPRAQYTGTAARMTDSRLS